MLTGRILKEDAVTKEDFTKISSAVDNTIFIMHNRLLNTEDQKLLEENYPFRSESYFITSLFRRQSNKWLFKVSSGADAFFKERSRVNLREALYTVVKEISTNDLKYGDGKSEWNFSIEENGSEQLYLILGMRSKTNYQTGVQLNNSSGRGAAHIQQRLAEIGGRNGTGF